MNKNQPANQASLPMKFFAVLITLSCVWAAWKIFFFLYHALVSSSAPIQAVVVAGSLTIFGSVISLIYSARNQKRREIEAEHREKKSEIYEKFMEFWLGTLLREKLEQSPVTQVEIFQFFQSFNQKMIVWGSDEVLKQYLAFRASSQESDTLPPMQILEELEVLMFTMRVDLGHANKNLQKHDLLRLFINDLDEIAVQNT